MARRRPLQEGPTNKAPSCQGAPGGKSGSSWTHGFPTYSGVKAVFTPSALVGLDRSGCTDHHTIAAPVVPASAAARCGPGRSGCTSFVQREPEGPAGHPLEFLTANSSSARRDGERRESKVRPLNTGVHNKLRRFSKTPSATPMSQVSGRIRKIPAPASATETPRWRHSGGSR